MALMGVPLYLLYESGILLIRLMGLDEKKEERVASDS
jgi:Sec-independent protein secretion pathway component TatC